jgi:hypothetical protein
MNLTKFSKEALNLINNNLPLTLEALLDREGLFLLDLTTKLRQSLDYDQHGTSEHARLQ